MESTCLFCQIVNGEKPAYKIYEDEYFLAFLDLFPYGPGHTLVIPKEHYRWIWDMPNIGEYMEVAKKVANHLRKKLDTNTVYSMIFGEQIAHVHIHLLPPLPEAQEKLQRGFLGIRQPQLNDAVAVEMATKLSFSK